MDAAPVPRSRPPHEVGLTPVIVDDDVRERWWHKVDPASRQTTNLVAVLDEHGHVVITQEIFSRLMQDAGWTPGRADLVRDPRAFVEGES